MTKMPNIGGGGWTDAANHPPPEISYRGRPASQLWNRWGIVLRQRPPVFLPNFVHKSKLFFLPPSLLSLWGRRNQSSMMLVRYLRAPCCPSPSPEFSNPSIFKEKKNSTHLLPLLGSGKVAKKFPLPLDFHNRSHTSSAPRTQKSAPRLGAAESKVQLVSKWKMSFRKFLIAAAAIGVKGALPVV